MYANTDPTVSVPDENVKELAVELVQLGFISEVSVCVGVLWQSSVSVVYGRGEAVSGLVSMMSIPL